MAQFHCKISRSLLVIHKHCLQVVPVCYFQKKSFYSQETGLTKVPHSAPKQQTQLVTDAVVTHLGPESTSI